MIKTQLTTKEIISLLQAIRRVESKPGLKVIRLLEKRRIEVKKLTRIKAG